MRVLGPLRNTSPYLPRSWSARIPRGGQATPVVRRPLQSPPAAAPAQNEAHHLRVPPATVLHWTGVPSPLLLPHNTPPSKQALPLTLHLNPPRTHTPSLTHTRTHTQTQTHTQTHTHARAQAQARSCTPQGACWPSGCMRCSIRVRSNGGSFVPHPSALTRHKCTRRRPWWWRSDCGGCNGSGWG